MLAEELVMVKQGDGRIEIASQMVCGIMLVESAAVAVDTAAVEHTWERCESCCDHELSNPFGSFASPRVA